MSATDVEVRARSLFLAAFPDREWPPAAAECWRDAARAEFAQARRVVAVLGEHSFESVGKADFVGGLAGNVAECSCGHPSVGETRAEAVEAWELHRGLMVVSGGSLNTENEEGA